MNDSAIAHVLMGEGVDHDADLDHDGVCQVNAKARLDNAKHEDHDRYVLVGDLFPVDRIGAALDWSWSFLASLVGLALPGTALAYWLWYRILGDVALNRANAFSFLVPVFGLTMGVIFYRESLDGLTAAGVGLTILGIVLVNWRKEPKNNQNALQPEARH